MTDQPHNATGDYQPVPDTILADGVISNPNRRHGAPLIAGTRITVDDILERVSAGRSIDDIIAAYRYAHLTREQVLHALAYARTVYTQATASVGSDASEDASWS